MSKESNNWDGRYEEAEKIANEKAFARGASQIEWSVNNPINQKVKHDVAAGMSMGRQHLDFVPDARKAAFKAGMNAAEKYYLEDND